VDHTNVNEADGPAGAAEPSGVVTAAIAAVTPPPVGGPSSEIAATIPAPGPGTTDPTAEPARPATV
ncbi:inorganic phosphate transporter, partial [Streptomyces niveus]